MAKYHRSRLLSYACACALGLAGTASAQESISVLEEIVVTAQKRSENLQEVPIAVTALTSQTRELIGITTIEDMTNFVPGLTYEGQLDRANIRGIGRVINAVGTDPAVGMYVDGVYNSSTTIAGRSTIFTDRVEVLRGPQGSLYGRNTTAGAVNSVSRQPKDSLGIDIRARYGDYDRKVIEGSLTGPITDWLRFRVTAAVTKQDDGYFTNYAPGYSNEGGNQDDRDYETVFAADLGESVDLSVRYTRREQKRLDRFSANFGAINYSTTSFFGSIGALNFSPATSFTGRTGIQPSALFNGTTPTATLGSIPVGQVYTVPNPASPSNRRAFSANVPTERAVVGYDGVSTNLVWHLPSMDIKWIGGYTNYQYYALSDSDNIAREFYDYTPLNNTDTVRIYTGTHLRFSENKDYYSNELNFTSTTDGPVEWLLGLYQYHERYEQVPIGGETRNPQQYHLQTVYVRPTALPTGNYAAQAPIYNSWTQVAYTNPAGATTSTTAQAVVDSYAAFGQASWQFTDQLKATLGGRYSRDEKQGWERRFAVIWDPSVVGERAKAFDNSAPSECYTNANDRDPNVANFQATRIVGTNALVPVTAAGGTVTSTCRLRTFGQRVWTDFSPSTGLEWKPMDDFLTYAKYSRGYKSGAIRIGSFNADAEANPEHVNTFEVGAKATIAGRLQVNTALFYNGYDDYQFPVTLRDPVDNSAHSEYVNVDAKTWGAELETIWSPIDPLSLWLTYSYLRTELTSNLYLIDNSDPLAQAPDASKDILVISATQVAQNAKGGELPNSPTHKASLNVNYTWKFSAGSLIPSVSYSWRGSMSSAGLSISPLSRKTNSTPSYGTTDAAITWQDADGRYSVIGNVANALDDQTVNSAQVDPTDSTRQVYNLNPPRTWILTLQYRFGSEVR